MVKCQAPQKEIFTWVNARKVTEGGKGREYTKPKQRHRALAGEIPPSPKERINRQYDEQNDGRQETSVTVTQYVCDRDSRQSGADRQSELT